MEPIIAWVLALFFVQTLLSPAIRYLHARAGLAGRLRIALGPRDQPPPETPLSARSARALANLQEALPIFLTVALLHVHRGTGAAAAPWGAAFALARTLYVPAYLSGVPGLRSAVWVSSWIGLGGMIVALLRS
ncbi:MAG: MAPEG family protein [Myxococcota bacterium]